MRLEHQTITRIQQANDIIDVVSEHVSLVNKGREMVGLCPFHEDHKPSMYVNPDKQIFKCFACGAGGDVIKFVQMREGLSFMRAVERLAARAGIEISPVRDKPKGSGPEIDPVDIEKVNRWAMGIWQKNLNDAAVGRVCRDYVDQRKIPAEVAKEYSFGFAAEKWDDILIAARQRKIPERFLTAAGLIVKNEQGKCYDKFRNRLMFPIIDASSRILGFGGRTLGDDPAKYMNSPATILFDKSNCVYGLDKARHKIVSSQTAVIVEGYTDVIMAHRFGCKNVVATLGTSLTAGHARLLRRYAKNIVLIFDSDIAGASAAERALEICLAEKIDIKVASVPSGKDPCDYLLTAGADGFNNVIDNAVDVMRFRWNKLSEKFGKSDNITDRRKATEDFLRTVSTAISSGTVDAITQGLIINRLSGLLHMRPEDIRKEIERKSFSSAGRGTVNTIANAKVSRVNTSRNFGGKAQEEIIETLLNEPRLFASAAREISADSFDVPLLKQIWQLLEQMTAEGADFALSDMLACVESTELADTIVKLSDNGQDSELLRRRLSGAMQALCEYNDKKKNQGKNDIDDERLRKITSIKNRPDRRNPGFMPI